jgi:hypothetical protein
VNRLYRKEIDFSISFHSNAPFFTSMGILEEPIQRMIHQMIYCRIINGVG